MANMSYCRYQNTLSDLRDAFDAMGGGEFDDREGESELSDDEARARRALIALCVTIAEEFGDEAGDEPGYGR